MNPRRWIFYPVLFAAYPVIFLYAHNLDGSVGLASVARDLVTVIACTLVAWWLLSRLLKSSHKSALLASILVVMFFAYGSIREAGENLLGMTGPRELPFIWIVLIVSSVLVAAKSRREPTNLNPVLSVVAVALLMLNAVPIANHGLTTAQASETVVIDGLPEPGTAGVPQENMRDIYYLIFDRYANERTLVRDFNFDNSDVLDFLERQGFVVAHKSDANHLRTPHSLASSLNMTYLNRLMGESHPVGSGDYEPLFEMIRDSKVAEYLRSIGYTHYNVGSWWEPTKDSPKADVDYSLGLMSQFSRVLLNSTFIPDLYESFFAEKLDQRAVHVKTFEEQIERLPSIERDPRPTFTFVHFLMPHDPYVFDRYGNILTTQDLEGRDSHNNYIEQLRYTNKEMEHLVKGLLDGSPDADPIIIIQSDEGPHPDRVDATGEGFDWFYATDAELKMKLRILNAYYFPGGHDGKIYQTISPVNSFRLLFNEYLGTELPLLPDKSYVHRNSQDLYTFKEVTDRLR